MRKRLEEESFGIGVGGPTGLNNGICTGGDGKGVFAFPLGSIRKRRKRRKRTIKENFSERRTNLLKVVLLPMLVENIRNLIAGKAYNTTRKDEIVLTLQDSIEDSSVQVFVLSVPGICILEFHPVCDFINGKPDVRLELFIYKPHSNTRINNYMELESEIEQMFEQFSD